MAEVQKQTCFLNVLHRHKLSSSIKFVIISNFILLLEFLGITKVKR